MDSSTTRQDHCSATLARQRRRRLAAALAAFVVLAGAALSVAWAQKANKAAPQTKAQDDVLRARVEQALKGRQPVKSKPPAQVQKADAALQARRQANKAKLTKQIRTQGGVPIFAIVSQMADNYIRGKAPAGEIERDAFATFRQARRETVQKIASNWRSLPGEKKSLLAGPVLKAELVDASRATRFKDATVLALMDRSYAQRLKRNVQPNTGPTIPRGRIETLKKNTIPRGTVQPLHKKTSSTDFGGRVFLAAFQDIPTGPPGDIPTETRGIRQIFAGEVKCRNQEDLALFAIGDDEIFMIYWVLYRDPNDGIWVPETKTTAIYGGFSEDVVKRLNPTDAVIFQSNSGQGMPSTVEVKVGMYEDDTDDFTWREALVVTNAVSQRVIAAWLAAKYQIHIPEEAMEMVDDALEGLAESVDRITWLGTDTMEIRATGVQGAPTNLTVTGFNYSSPRKYEFTFQEAEGDYRLRDIRIVTVPEAVNGGRLSPPRT